MEGNETLHTSHLQCHIFIPLLVFPLPASASHQQHPSVDKRKDLLPVLHPASLLKGENMPSVLLCHAFASAVPPPTPLPISACLITWSAQPIKSFVLHLPSSTKTVCTQQSIQSSLLSITVLFFRRQMLQSSQHYDFKPP